MWEASAYRVGKTMEVDEMTLAKNEENGGGGGAGCEIHGPADLPRIIITWSVCAWFILQTQFGSFFLITSP